MEVSKLLALARIKLDDPLWDGLDDDSLFKTNELVEYLNQALREVVFRGKLIVKSDVTLNLVTDQDSYAVPDGMIIIGKILDENNEPIIKIQEVDLDNYYRNDTATLPTHFFQSLISNKLIFHPTPTADSIVKLEGTFVPIIDDALGSSDDLPVELSEIYQRDLIHWILYEAFDKPDADTYDPKKSERSKKRFTDIFGEKLPADQLQEIIGYPDDPGSHRDFL